MGTTDAPLHLPAGRTDAEFDRRLAAHDAQVRAERPPGRPEVVVLCGSTRFEDAFTEAMRDQTLAGRIVLSVGLFGHPEGVDMDGPTTVMLGELHKRKIDLADRVLVLNVGGYIGSSTRSEIDYAIAHGKPVDYLEAPRV